MAAENPFGYLNFLLQFCPPTGPAAVEVPLRAVRKNRGRSWEAVSAKQQPRSRTEGQLAGRRQTGLAKIKQQVESLGTNENGWQVSTKVFGDRKKYAGNWTLRAAAAMAGIYGNDSAEALYPLLAGSRMPAIVIIMHSAAARTAGRP
jgi:hypothetical protein